MNPSDKPLLWLHSEIKTPPFSKDARLEAGFLLRRLQRGERLSLPQSRPMSQIGPDCHELRVQDRGHTWRIAYHIDDDFLVVLGIFEKHTMQTSKKDIDICRKRFKDYRLTCREAEK